MAPNPQFGNQNIQQRCETELKETSIGNGRIEEPEAHQKINDTHEVPDGGWGWMIILAVFIGNLLIDGIIGCFGLLYPEIQEEFKASPAVTSLAGSTVVGVFLFSSLFWGGCIRIYGCRAVCFAGGCVCALGFVLSMFSQTILAFLVTYGILIGIGFGMNSISGLIIVNSYFNKRRGIAQGIVSSGAGAGVFLIAPLKQYFLSEYGWRGTMLMFAGIVLHFCACSCLMRPYKPLAVSDNIGLEKNVTDFETGTTTEKDPVTPVSGSLKQSLMNFKENSNACDNACKSSEEVPKENDKATLPLLREHENGRLPFGYLKSNSDFLTLDPNRKSKRKRTVSEFLPSHYDNGIQEQFLSSLPNLTKTYVRQEKYLASKTYSQDFDPFKRKDILYSGSLCHLREFQESNNVKSFVESMTVCDKTAVEITNLRESDMKGNTCLYSLKMFAQHLFDLSVFKNKLYIPIVIGAMFIQMSQFIPNTFIAEYGCTIGLNDGQISVVMAIYGVSNIFGRLSAGCLANIHWISPLWLCNFGTFMCGVVCVIFPLCKSFISLSIYAVGQGYFIGYFAPLQILILVQYLGLDKLTSSVGFMQMAKGPAAVAGPPLAGLVYQWTKSYGTAVQFAGLLSFFAAAVQSLAAVFDQCSRRMSREPNKKDECIMIIQPDEV